MFSLRSEFMRCVRAKKKLKLQPDRMIFTSASAPVVVVLQPQLGKLGGIPRQVRRNAPALFAQRIAPKPCAVQSQRKFLIIPALARHEVAPQARDPTLMKSVKHLRIDT